MQLCYYSNSLDFIYYLHIFKYSVEIMDFINQTKKQSAEMFCKKGVSKNLAKVTGKHPFQSVFLIKL